MNAFRFVVKESISVTGKGVAAVGHVTHGEISVHQTISLFDNSDAPQEIGQFFITQLEKFGEGIVEQLKVDDEGAIFLRGIDRDLIRRDTQVVEEGGQPIKIRPVEFDMDFPMLWKQASDKKMGLALQGGGVKGAFTVGALSLLADAGFITPEKVGHIASASTGSLTSLLVAELQGSVSAQKARNEYFRLMESRQMFDLKPEVKRIIQRTPILEEPIMGFLEGRSSERDFEELVIDEFVVDAKTIGLTLAGLVAGGPYGLIGAGLGLYLNTDEVKEAVQDLLKVKGSLARLNPVRARLKATFNIQRLKESGVTLRLAVVSADTGVVGYINENGFLLYPEVKDESEGHDWSQLTVHPIKSIGQVKASPINLKNTLIEAALTSGAFPGIFEPKKIKFKRGKNEVEEVFYDGGIRENQPIQILVQQGVNEIIAIYNSPLKSADFSHKKAKNTTWSALVKRSMDLTFEEVARTDSSY
ncbi:MAG: patatin-like phospholipase family protein, partial [Saprospiraceae bacterium]|nr:patatin-like phospholipase family protein [Saprospiraceae bacterium]